eukprot:2885052-Lingulodinium_polyedra.AAC.1
MPRPGACSPLPLTLILSANTGNGGPPLAPAPCRWRLARRAPNPCRPNNDSWRRVPTMAGPANVLVPLLAAACGRLGRGCQPLVGTAAWLRHRPKSAPATGRPRHAPQDAVRPRQRTPLPNAVPTTTSPGQLQRAAGPASIPGGRRAA